MNETITTDPKPQIQRLGLGVGMDLPWGAAVGFDPETNAPTARVQKFLERHAAEFSYLFFAFQPRGLSQFETELYLPAYQRLQATLPEGFPLALHQTTLNLGAIHPYDRKPVYQFTNRLTAQFGFRWIVEDIGIWSIDGMPLPYPLPPYLTAESLDRVAAQVTEARLALDSPLHIEFPGVTDGVSVVVGDLDAYDYFNALAERAEAWVTLDIGHLLAWRYLTGHRGSDLYGGLERLPLNRCRELHLSGCALSRGRFLDLHHGVLMDEQIVLCELLLERCPNLIAVTYEDPRYTREGDLVAKSVPNYEKLRRLVEQWAW